MTKEACVEIVEDLGKRLKKVSTKIAFICNKMVRRGLTVLKRNDPKKKILVTFLIKALMSMFEVMKI